MRGLPYCVRRAWTHRRLDIGQPPRDHGPVSTVEEAATRARVIAAAAIRDLDAFMESLDQRSVDEAFARLSDAVSDTEGAYDPAWTERFVATSCFAPSARAEREPSLMTSFRPSRCEGRESRSADRVRSTGAPPSGTTSASARKRPG